MAADLFLFLLVILPFVSYADPPSSDAVALLLLKDSFTNSTSLSSWSTSSSPCDPKTPWVGVVCYQGIVTGLRLESLSLSGSINVDALTHFKALRSISFSTNSFSGPIPPLNRLDALKAIYLSNNRFSGEIPDDFFTNMDHLKKLHLSNNGFTGPIPHSLSKVSTLIELHLEGNQFSGEIPPLNLPSLSSLDLSNNDLTGPIPATLGTKFNATSFSGNPELCGPPIAGKTCGSAAAAGAESGSGKVLAVVAAVLIAALVILVAVSASKRRREAEFDTLGVANGEMEAGESKGEMESNKEVSVKKEGGGSTHRSGHKRTGSSTKSVGPAAGEKAGGNDLVVVNDEKGVFGMPDLMKAAAEVMGNGGLGSAYKAVMGNGVAVAVKRVREMNRVGKEMFDVEMRRMGRLKHKNVLPPLAYHYRKDEKLLISEYIPKGSLLYILHGDRGMDHAALDWPTRLKIIVGIARGMAYLHAELNSLDIPHGNLKSGNILLAPDFEPLIVDYGFVPLVNPSQASQTMFAYKSPESLTHRHVSPKSDVYCFGIVILEVLTGKFPSQYLNNTKGGTDVVQWTNSAISENRVAELLDPAITTVKSSVPDMERLIKVCAACIETDPNERLDMKAACERIEEIAAEARKGAAEVGSGPSLKDGGYAELSGSSHASYVREGFGSLSAKRTGSITERSRTSGDNFSFAIS